MRTSNHDMWKESRWWHLPTVLIKTEEQNITHFFSLLSTYFDIPIHSPVLFFHSSLLYQSLETCCKTTFRWCACSKGVFQIHQVSRCACVYKGEKCTRGWIYSDVSSYCIPAGSIRLAHSLSAFANKRAKSSLVVRKYVHWIPDSKGVGLCVCVCVCVWKYVYSTCGYKEEDKKRKIKHLKRSDIMNKLRNEW
jgi:hypothetical protein